MSLLRAGRVVLDALVHPGTSSDVLSPPELSAEPQPAHNKTQSLRIAAVFVILAAGLLGGVPPLFLNVFRDQEGMLTRLVRSFSAGVILALALVHIIPEAVEEMAGLGGIEYPLGGTCVLFGVALMVFLEHLAHIMHGPHSHAPAADSAAAAFTALPSSCTDIEAGATPCGAAKRATAQTSSNCEADPSGVLASDSSVPMKSAMAVAVAEGVASGCCDGAAAGSEGTPAGGAPGDSCYTRASEPGHNHVCVSRGSAGNWFSSTSPAATQAASGSLRLKILAYMFELGCVFHSFIIGISLGVNTTDLVEVRALLIALSFHQFLEGVSLASVVLRGGFSTLKGAIMILTYSLTCPVGIAVGMAIASSYDAESERARGVQGTLNGVSGGMLMYISLVQLVAEDMGRFVPGSPSGGASARLLSFLALFLGAGSMCILAVWS
ncbi:hypothetical protein CHLRE_07g355150v5 [Chlamydomonas reinhardtii]|uniref:Zinc-nutrition responsive transporter n=1 Tax=Chlamydomonas reinhardtii TaxID=3055 RepID=A0A2K3DLL9_CHLRE|nr:uncharacterized protein CHLRE_07g355150v5 [Chlamydomonas reinhardtii]PNW81418.1 hypothetical protein CHLRE_07g355150v5 [Chlamydomonas reinhardtii]